MFRRGLILAIFTISSSFLFLGQDPLEKIVEGFDRYLRDFPQEKVFIHTDKPYYAAGERVWVKAYLVAGPAHLPSPLSRVIYVELINEQKKVIDQVKLYTTDGAAASDFTLPDSLASGNYTLRAYTNWMKNFEEDYFFHQAIKVWSLSAPAAQRIKEATIDLQFFPEGGGLIYGIRSKVAFKAIDREGKGMPINGKITDQEGQLVAEFKSNFLGMGQFAFVPQKGKRYIAHSNLLTTGVELPTARESGILLAVSQNRNTDNVVIKLQSEAAGKSAYVIAQTRGVVCYYAKVTMPNTLLYLTIPREKFPTGTAQITLLSDTGLPLAERLIFVEHEPDYSISIKSDKLNYQPREKVVIDIEAKDKKGNPLFADISLAVCDGGQVLVDDSRESIQSYLYLSSELKGYIESPGYYFNSKNAERVEDLDYLLLTQGWRKFSYEKATKNEWPSLTHNSESGLTISGQLLDKYTRKPIAEGKVTYLATFPSLATHRAVTNEKGYFVIPHVLLFDSTQALIQGETKRGNKWVKVLLDSTINSPVSHYPVFPIGGTLQEFEKAFIKAGAERKKIDEAYNFEGKTMVLESVEIVGKKEEQQQGPTKVYGTGNNTIKVADRPELENLTHPLQLIQGRVAGVQVTSNGASWNIIIRGPGSIMSGTSPLILINNTPVDIEALDQLSVRDIESVDIFKGAETAIFGSRGSNGVIIFYTKTGQNNVVSKREGLDEIRLDGMEVTRHFYAPKYDMKRPEHVKPDRRVTLYWAPRIKTDSTGKASITFYNHDLETTIIGVFEGLSASGEPLSGRFSYPIVKN